MTDRLLKESDVLKAVDKRIEELSKDSVFIRKNGSIDLYGIKKYLLTIPTAEGPQGEWINKGDYAECSNCGANSGTQYDGVEPIPLKTNFCPNCGAKMKGVDNE